MFLRFKTGLAAASLVLASSAERQLAQGDSAWAAAFGSGVIELPKGSSNRQRATPPPPPRPQPMPDVTVAATSTPKAGDVAEAQARTDAESLVATFQAANEAGASGLRAMARKEQVVAVLAQGIPGGGAFRDTVFRVPGLTPTRIEAALGKLSLAQGTLVLATEDPGTVPAPPPSATAPPTDSKQAFAEGWLKVAVPEAFTAEALGDGDLRLRAEGATLTLRLEKLAPELDAWSTVREAAEQAGKGVSISGKSIYLVLPDRRRPESAVVGVENALLQIEIETVPDSNGNNLVRFALPGICESLQIAR